MAGKSAKDDAILAKASKLQQIREEAKQAAVQRKAREARRFARAVSSMRAHDLAARSGLRHEGITPHSPCSSFV